MAFDHLNEEGFAGAIYQTVLRTVKSYLPFKSSKLEEVDAEDLTQEIITYKLLPARRKGRPIEDRGYFRRLVYNYVNSYLRKSMVDGYRPVIVEINEKHDVGVELSDEMEGQRLQRPSDGSPLYNYLSQDPGNGAFRNLKKWLNWKPTDHETCKGDILLPETNISRVGLLTLDPADYNVYINPMVLLTRYDMWLRHNAYERDYMEWAILEMCKSKSEADLQRRKIDPMVGAILVDSNGRIIAAAHRGKYEEKGHAEYNLLEHDVHRHAPWVVKRRYKVPPGQPGEHGQVTELELDGGMLFVTLEPCSTRSKGKCSCADRIIYSGIKTVYVGLKDPDGDIDGNGILKLERAGIRVKYFQQDLLMDIIRAKNALGQQQNLDFILSKRNFYLDQQPEVFVKHITGS